MAVDTPQDVDEVLAIQSPTRRTTRRAVVDLATTEPIERVRMRILVDIGHPAHVHFFKHTVANVQEQGHQVLITSRDKEIALDLLDKLGLEHTPLSAQKGSGVLALGRELISRNVALYRQVRRFRPDVMVAIGGIFVAQVGWLTRIPSLVFYDTENAKLQNALTYPFASAVIVPRCYEAWVPRGRHIRYRGYHELAYLHPDYFTASRTVALANGLATEGETFLLRMVSWRASHDLSERGWTPELARELVAKLSLLGKVLISAEGQLPDDLERYRFRGDVRCLHHLMAHCRAFVGESATMASECAVLGVPAIYAANTGRGYTNEQERRYGLVRNLFNLDWMQLSAVVDQVLAKPRAYWKQQRQRLLEDTIDVTAFVTRCILGFPQPLHEYRQSGPYTAD